jgi:hypothetical protein
MRRPAQRWLRRGLARRCAASPSDPVAAKSPPQTGCDWASRLAMMPASQLQPNEASLREKGECRLSRYI